MDKKITPYDSEKEELYEHFNFTVDSGQSAQRIDKFLTAKILNVSRNRIQNAARAECILANGIAVKNNYKVRPHDSLSIVLPFPPRDRETKPEDIALNIVYEDEDIILVNKEPGMVVHPAHGNFTATLINALLFHVNKLADNKDETRPGLVHRIDKDTSGILLVAKTEFALTFLAKQFFEHSIERVYHALVWGVPDPVEGTISNYIGRDPKDRTKMKNYVNEDFGRRAVTRYKVIKNMGYVSLVECRLETGRTHQIRVHFAGIGHPVFNDEKYGGNLIKYGPAFSKYRQFVINCFGLLARQGLHAKSLGFIHPATKKNIYFDSELPADMQACIEKWDAYINPK